VLENVPPWAHVIEMAEKHPFTIRLEPDLLRDRRFRWTLYENGQLRKRSVVSYATKREAIADATKALAPHAKTARRSRTRTRHTSEK
jgi:hypothetical protein